MRRFAIEFALVLFVQSAAGFAQAPAATADQRLAFEVASIKVSKADLPGPVWAGTGPGRFVVDGITAANLIRNAYDLRPDEIIGAPGWLDAERFQVNATYAAGASSTQVNVMLRSLLEDRFALKAHREDRDLPKYRLVPVDATGQLGPQLKKSAGQCPRPHPETPCMMKFGGNELVMQEATIRQFLNFLESVAQRRIEDHSGLSGEYDLTLSWSGSGNDPQRPVLVTALHEQLRLKLEPTRGPVSVLIIDSVARPTPD